MPLLLLGLEELITEMFPLLRGEGAQDPATLESQVGLSGESSGGSQQKSLGETENSSPKGRDNHAVYLRKLNNLIL